MKKILVPTDFSDTSINAFAYALKMAKILNAEITLLHAIDIPILEGSLSVADHLQSQLGSFKELAENKFKAILEQNKSNISVTTIVEFDSAINSILKYTESTDVEMVVMGTKGMSNWSRALVGSITSKVIRQSEVPVLSVPEGIEFKRINSTVIVSDYDINKIENYKTVLERLKPFNTMYHLLKIITPSDFETSAESLNKMRAFGEQLEAPVGNCVPYAEYNILDGIKSFHTQIGCDLTIMATNGRTGLNNLIHRSETENVAKQCDFPILTFKI